VSNGKGITMEIIAFAQGNPQDPQTWSNVPYFAVKTLENMGHTVRCVDILPKSALLKKLIKFTNKAMRFVLGRDTLFLVELWPIWQGYYRSVIKKACDKYPSADLLLFFTYNLSSKDITGIPAILFNDFTIDYVIRELHKREPKWYEKKLIKSQDQIIKNADCVISLFPKAAQYYRDYYKTDNIFEISGHILNCDESIGDLDSIIQTKYESKEILFIGRKSYKNGALCLIEAINRYNTLHAEAPLHLSIIGMTEAVLGISPSSAVKCYGILNKSQADQKNMYYDTIRKAKCVVNTTKNWGGISSMSESMYFATPIITTPYSEFVEIFGETIDCGYYSKGEDVADLVDKLHQLMSLPTEKYASMSRCAHESVKDFTWENCMKHVLGYILESN
jgi:glycosyltransferase involved in cell wall biosynthesis